MAGSGPNREGEFPMKRNLMAGAVALAVTAIATTAADA